MKTLHHYITTALAYLFAIGFGMMLTAAIVYGKSWEAYAGLIVSALGIIFATILHKQINTEETED